MLYMRSTTHSGVILWVSKKLNPLWRTVNCSPVRAPGIHKHTKPTASLGLNPVPWHLELGESILLLFSLNYSFILIPVINRTDYHVDHLIIFIATFKTNFVTIISTLSSHLFSMNITLNYSDIISLDVFHVVNEFSIGLQRPISSNHHTCVLMVYCLANRVKRLFDD